jgi:hypothetical protein
MSKPIPTLNNADQSEEEGDAHVLGQQEQSLAKQLEAAHMQIANDKKRIDAQTDFQTAERTRWEEEKRHLKEEAERLTRVDESSRLEIIKLKEDNARLLSTRQGNQSQYEIDEQCQLAAKQAVDKLNKEMQLLLDAKDKASAELQTQLNAARNATPVVGNAPDVELQLLRQSNLHNVELKLVMGEKDKLQTKVTQLLENGAAGGGHALRPTPD